MKRLLVITFLASLAAAAQGLFPWPDPAQLARKPAVSAAVPYDGYPTNVAGAPVIAWWVAADYVTNSETWVSMPDRWTNSLALTNRGAAGVWPTFQASGLNGLPTLLFDGVDDQVKNGLTNFPPLEFVFVLSLTNNSDWDSLFDSTNATYRVGLIVESRKWGLNDQDGGPGLGKAVTNAFHVLDFMYNGPTPVLYSNNVQSSPGFNISTTNGISGLTVGGNYVPGNFQHFVLAECIIFSATLTATVRSNIYSYLTNKYAIVL